MMMMTDDADDAADLSLIIINDKCEYWLKVHVTPTHFML